MFHQSKATPEQFTLGVVLCSAYTTAPFMGLCELQYSCRHFNIPKTLDMSFTLVFFFLFLFSVSFVHLVVQTMTNVYT